jgi:radical SAM/Cys-rich protein
MDVINKNRSNNTFDETLENYGFLLNSRSPEILQLNLGYLCNQQCSHCHVDASPYRKELMSREILESCLHFIDRNNIKTVDLTGGAPEMNPHFEWLLDELSKRNIEIIVRSNLTILMEGKFKGYPELFHKYQVRVISSLPCYTEENVDKQRGNGVFIKSIEALKKLNKLGYGSDPKLILDLVYNPGGPSIAPNQQVLELEYKQQLKDDFNIDFNQLFCITNLPISRFLDDLKEKGLEEEYMNKLINSFNPSTVDNLMCTNTLSVSYDGQVYDCDFNQMLKINSNGIDSIKAINQNKLIGRNISTGKHCFGCTAGEGSSCQGAIS